jgi:hypothetical protein
VLDRLLEEAALGTKAGVGEERVEPAEALERGGHERLLVFPAGHVAAHGQSVLGTAELLGEPLELLLGARGQHHALAELDRAAGGGGTDAGAGAGDD